MRCNAGVPPSILLDQHLIAEYRELLIPLGQLYHVGFRESKTPIPAKLKLGKGHILFWRDKQLYLKRRHGALVEEMTRRGFQTNYSFWPLSKVPKRYLGDWAPDEFDSAILRERIAEKIMLKPTWYRMNRINLADVDSYLELLVNSPVEY